MCEFFPQKILTRHSTWRSTKHSDKHPVVLISKQVLTSGVVLSLSTPTCTLAAVQFMSSQEELIIKLPIVSTNWYILNSPERLSDLTPGFVFSWCFELNMFRGQPMTCSLTCRLTSLAARPSLSQRALTLAIWRGYQRPAAKRSYRGTSKATKQPITYEANNVSFAAVTITSTMVTVLLARDWW